MDRKRQATKRPRSSTPNSERKNKKKKSKRSEKQAEGSKEGTTHAKTATTDGDMMAQMLSTFSNIEQSRFQAFQRASFNQTCIEEFIGSCLGQPLEELCGDQQAAEISMVVSIAAKIYAQRLLSEAVQHKSNGSDTVTVANILQAFQDRQRRGVDPGFFMQPPSESSTYNWNADCTSRQHYDQRRLVVEQLQEEADERDKKAASTESTPNKEDTEADDKMEVEASK